MITHLEIRDGTPACGSQKLDPDLTADPEDVTCKRCLDVQQTADAHKPTTQNEDPARASKSTPLRARSKFLTYEEVLRLCLKSILLGIVGAVALVLPREARADDSSREARVLYQKGSAAFKEGDDVLAREYYSKSLELEESFDTMCNLGRSEARSLLFPEAYEHLLLCLYLFPKDEQLQEARASYVILRNKVRAEISYEVAHPLDERVDEEIERREAEATSSELDALPASGLDSVEVAPERKSERSAKLPVAITIGSLGVVGLGTGAAFMLSAASHKRKAESLSAELPGNSACVDPSADERCGELETRLKKLDSNRTAGVVGYAVGGTLLAGAVVTYLLWPKPKKVPAVQATLSVEKAGGFVSLAGSF